MELAMGSRSTPLRGTQSFTGPVRALLVVAALIGIAMAANGSRVVLCLVLTIRITCAVVAVFWQACGVGIDSPPADLCVRCGRGLIARVGVSRRGSSLRQFFVGDRGWWIR
jgi:hypothetical protein